MKTPASHPFGRTVACALATLSLHLAGATTSPANPAAPKTHTLWVGAQFSVEWQGQPRPVVGVDGGTFIVEVDGKRVTVPSLRSDLSIKIDDTLKLSTRSANVADLKGERTYTRENDPRTKFNRAFATGAGASAATSAAAVNMVNNQLAAANPKNPLGPENARAAEQAYNSTAFAGGSDLNSAGAHAARMGAELAEEKFDAFDLTFTVSSPQPLEQPYLIVVTRYREQAGDPKSGRIWVYADTLERITNQPRQIRLTRGGFPPGYELIDFRVHLYDGGQEIATSVARKRTELTTDEAFQFSVIDYIGRHRDATLAPVPVRAFIPVGLRSRLPAETLPQTVYVKVAADGRPLGAYSDQAATSPLTETSLAHVVTELRFHPALAKGKPCEGIAAVELAQVLR